VIATGSRTDRPDYDYSDGVTLQIYQLEGGKQATVEIPALDGKIETRFNIKRDGKAINIRRQGSSKAWNVFLVGIDYVQNMENMEIETIDGSTMIRADHTANELTIQLT
jgi:alpha-D-xyloside xylohydrolase